MSFLKNMSFPNAFIGNPEVKQILDPRLKHSGMTVCFILFILFFITFAHADINDGLVGYWQFDGNANNTSSNSNNGTLVGSSTFSTGQIGQALTFNGSNTSISMGSDPITTGDITVSAWVYPTNLGSNANYYYIISDGHFYLGITTSYSGNNFYGSNDGSSAVNASWGSVLPNKWQLLTAVRKSNGTFSLYVNGVLSGAPDRAGGGSITAGSKMVIGRRYDPAYYWNGSIDDVRVYNRALSASEIQQLYQEGLSGSSSVVVSLPSNPPVISSVFVSNIDTSSATISWITDQASTSQLVYGLTSGYGFQTAQDSAQVTAHSLTIPDLAADTDYHYSVISTNLNGTAQSKDDTFTTSSQNISLPSEIISDDRRIDWSNAGIPGGIPDRQTICATVMEAPYNAKGDGTTDDTAAIQNALNQCAGSNGVVYLPPGTYRVSRLQMNSGESLRGAGPSQTTVLGKTSWSPEIISMVGNRFNLWYYADFLDPSTVNKRVYANVIGGAVKGSNSITLDNNPGIQQGDFLLLTQKNDGQLVDPTTNQGWIYGCTINPGDTAGSVTDQRCLGQVLHVSSVSGNTVNLDNPVNWTYQSSLKPMVAVSKGYHWLTGAGIEYLKVRQPTERTDQNHIQIGGAAYSWVKGVEIQDVTMRGIEMLTAYHVMVVDSYLHDGPVNNQQNCGRNRAYGISLDGFSTGNLIYNNMIKNLDGGGITTNGGSNGNVISYNNFASPCSYDSKYNFGGPGMNHGAFPYMNLWEGNIAVRHIADVLQGSSGYNTVFRAYSPGWTDTQNGNQTPIYNNIAIGLEAHQRYYNIVANVLGKAGFSNKYQIAPGDVWLRPGDNPIYGLGNGISDPNPSVLSTLHRLANYDVIHNCVWDDTYNICLSSQQVSSLNIPASLYLSSKPSWFGNVAWPPIGPDVNGYTNKIPAQICYENQNLAKGGTFDPKACYSSSSSTLSGDVSGDGKVTMYDAALVLRFTLGSNLTDVQKTAADINADGKVDGTDVVAIAKRALGL